MPNTALLLKFKDADTANTVTRATVRRMSEALGFNDTQVVQYALARLRSEVLPAYEADDGPLSASAIRQLKKLADQSDYQPTRSLLPGL